MNPIDIHNIFFNTMKGNDYQFNHYAAGQTFSFTETRIKFPAIKLTKT